MAFTNVAIVGLSASAKTSWASGAHIPYLQSARGRQHYKVVALLNSTEAAAKASAEAYFPDEKDSIKTYGNPEDLAADPNVDLIVNNTRVDVHHPTSLPSVLKGKKAYIEWPLSSNEKLAAELRDASTNANVVGLQGRYSPILAKLKETIASGAIGKVLSTEIRSFGGIFGRDKIIEGLEYFAHREIGGNVFTISGGHLFDQVQSALGEFEDIQTHLQLQWPHFNLIKPATGAVTGTATSNVPDYFTFTARLPASETTEKDASVLFYFRRGPPFPGDSQLTWSVFGTKGELRITAESDSGLHVTSAGVKLRLHDFESNEVKDVEWKWEPWQEELPLRARSVATVYERLANGESVPTFAEATKRHGQLDGFLAKWAKTAHNA